MSLPDGRSGAGTAMGSGSSTGLGAHRSRAAPMEATASLILLHFREVRG